MNIKLAPFEVYKVYNDEILKLVSITGGLSVDSVIDLSLKLYTSIQVKGVEYSEVENDMLLFQYGTYDWGDEKGEHATFDITRQFQNIDCDEFYQLSFSLIFDSTILDKDDSYNAWSCSYASLDEWVNSIKETAGYTKMKQVNFRTYEINLQET